MPSSIPNSAINAGRNAVIGMDLIGAATGFTKSCIQPKLAISRPSGIAINTHQKNACAMRHQLCATFSSRLYSVHNRPKALTTPSGCGTENGGANSQYVTPNQTRIITPQLASPNATLARGETSLRIVNRSAISLGTRDSGIP